MDCSPPGSSVPGILQARIPERVTIPISRGSSRSRDWTGVFCGSCIAGRPFTAEPLHLHYCLKSFSDSLVLIKWRSFSLTWFISASQFSFPTSSQMLFELVVVPQRTCFVLFLLLCTVYSLFSQKYFYCIFPLANAYLSLKSQFASPPLQWSFPIMLKGNWPLFVSLGSPLS